jgi:transposase
MEQIQGLNLEQNNKYELLNKVDLVQEVTVLRLELEKLVKENYQLRNQQLTATQLQLVTEEQLAELRRVVFAPSSEKYKKPKKEEKKEKKPAGPRIKKPSERYPNAPVRVDEIVMNPIPNCENCHIQLTDTGMVETSEYLTVIPKKIEIVVQKRIKYGCNCCHGVLETAPCPPRVVQGSSYSDEMMIDVVLSKYCDLIPVQRYVGMAARNGVKDIPPHSLIELTHFASDFLISVYLKIKEEVMSAKVLHADETTHRMLEGSSKMSWYLWGFSSLTSCYFECHDTRSGDVASELLKYANCRYLVTDVYSGYGKAVREVNKFRQLQNLEAIISSYCNTHSRRYFFKAKDDYPEATFYLDQYVEIYKLNTESKGKPPDEVLKIREKMRPYFDAMKDRIPIDLAQVSDKCKFALALKYLQKNFEGLTLFLDFSEIPIDNNPQERLLRSPVVGRKTWYGTHSKRGARTAAIHFTIVESCKLIDVNPREYYPYAINSLLTTGKAMSPFEFKNHKQALQ